MHLGPCRRASALSFRNLRNSPRSRDLQRYPPHADTLIERQVSGLARRRRGFCSCGTADLYRKSDCALEAASLPTMLLPDDVAALMARAFA